MKAIANAPSHHTAPMFAIETITATFIDKINGSSNTIGQLDNSVN